jgi:hypothetical protein
MILPKTKYCLHPRRETMARRPLWSIILCLLLVGFAALHLQAGEAAELEVAVIVAPDFS